MNPIWEQAPEEAPIRLEVIRRLGERLVRLLALSEGPESIEALAAVRDAGLLQLEAHWQGEDQRQGPREELQTLHRQIIHLSRQRVVAMPVATRVSAVAVLWAHAQRLALRVLEEPAAAATLGFAALEILSLGEDLLGEGGTTAPEAALGREVNP